MQERRQGLSANVTDLNAKAVLGEMLIERIETLRAGPCQNVTHRRMQRPGLWGLPPRRHAGRQPRCGREDRIFRFRETQARREVDVYARAGRFAEGERHHIAKPRHPACNDVDMVAGRANMTGGHDWMPVGVQTDTGERMPYHALPVLGVEAEALRQREGEVRDPVSLVGGQPKYAAEVAACRFQVNPCHRGENDLGTVPQGISKRSSRIVMRCGEGPHGIIA